MGQQDDRSDSFHVVLVFLGISGGMVQYSTQVANAVSAHAEVTVVAPKSNEVCQLLNDSIEIHQLTHPDVRPGKVGTVLAGMSAVYNINKFILQERPDIIHLPFLAGLPSVVVLPFLWLHRVPLIGTVHDPISHEGQEITILGVDVRVIALRHMSHILDGIIVHGQECKQEAIDAGYPTDKLHVFPHGLYSHFRTADCGDSVVNRENVLLFFGKIRPNKGFDRIPAIIDGVAEEVPDVTAVVAGTSDVGWQIDQDELEGIVADLQAHERIELYNRYIPNDEVGRFFREASAVVLPYYDATASGVALIAYTFEKPIVATKTGDMGHMIKRDGTGVLAQPESTSEIIEAAIKVLTDSELQNELVENIQNCKDRYSWETIGKRTVSLYRTIQRK